MDFNQLYDSYEVEMLQDAYDTIKRLELWDWLREFEPQQEKGFMFSSNSQIEMLNNSLCYSHSGTSFAWTIRTIQHIAKYGWEEHKKLLIEKRDPSCLCRRAKGKLVGWCGVPGCQH